MTNSISDNDKCRFLQKLVETVPQMATQNVRVEKVADQKLTLRLPYREELIGNPDTRAVHTGALTVLLDNALGFAGCIRDDFPPTLTPTLDLRIDHLAVAPAGSDILATAWVYRVTSKILFVEGYAWCEASEKILARATGNFVRLKEFDISKVAEVGVWD